MYVEQHPASIVCVGRCQLTQDPIAIPICSVSDFVPSIEPLSRPLRGKAVGRLQRLPCLQTATSHDNPAEPSQVRYVHVWSHRLTHQQWTNPISTLGNVVRQGPNKLVFNSVGALQGKVRK